MNKFVELIHAQSQKLGMKDALRFHDYLTEEWKSLTWCDLENVVDDVAAALFSFGVQPQSRLCLFTQNCPEIFITHFASFYNRAVPVPIYATSSRDEAAHIVNDSGATLLFSGDQEQYEIARELLTLCPTLKQVVTLNPTVQLRADDHETITWQQFVQKGRDAKVDAADGIAKRKVEGTDDDLMYLIYTSGTTGEPKGVMLTHSNFNYAMWAHGERIPVNPDKDVSLSFLPLSHIFELGWSMFCLIKGVVIAINRNPKDIQKTIKEVSPTIMCSVPRFWEKVYTAIDDNLGKAAPVLRMLVKRAIAVGRTRNLKYVRNGKKVPFLLEKQYQYFEKKVYCKLRKAVGIPNGRFFPTAGAMLSDRITEFLHSVGINIVIGYGLSETNASVCFFESEGWEIGTIGYPIPGVEVKIGAQNEILVKGPTVMKGYFNKPEETAKAIDADGWFHTGDCGQINDKGQIIMTERLKDLFKTSNGKYIAPQVLETMLGQDKYIEQVAIIGDGRKYVSALIVPSFENIRTYAKEKNIEYSDNTQLVNSPELHRMIEERINEYQKDMASYEQIKRFVLLPRPFTMETGELTNTLKIRRSVVAKRYAALIDAMYAADFRKHKDKNKE